MAPSAALHRSKMKPERLPLSLGVAGLLALSIVPPAGAQGKPDSADRFPPKSDWSRVQTLKPGMRTTVKLYDEEAPKGKRAIKGKSAFWWFTASCLLF